MSLAKTWYILSLASSFRQLAGRVESMPALAHISSPESELNPVRVW